MCKVSRDVLFAQRCEYHRNLTARRWQYFAVALFLNALLVKVWADATKLSKPFRIAFCIAAVIVAAVMVRLIGRSRRRIRANAEAANEMAGGGVFEVGREGSAGWEGVTIWLYLALTVAAAPWVVALWELSRWASGLAALAFIASVLFSGVRHRA
jgi:hypothetical protein